MNYFYSAHLYYTARPDEPLTMRDGKDRMFMVCADPVPDLDTAQRMAWFCLGKWSGDYALLFFESDEQLLDDEGVWTFKPRYRLTAPNRDNGTIEPL